MKVTLPRDLSGVSRATLIDGGLSRRARVGTYVTDEVPQLKCQEHACSSDYLQETRHIYPSLVTANSLVYLLLLSEAHSVLWQVG